MQITAKAKYIRMSPKKIRLVADVVRGLEIKDALTQLRFINKQAALPLAKLLNSVIANAENNSKLKKDTLYVKKIVVNGGPTLSRWRPRAYGRAGMIRKRSAHIEVTLDEKSAGAEKIATKPQKTPKPVRRGASGVTKVKSLDEVKKMVPSSERLIDKKSETSSEEHPSQILDPRREAKHRHQEHLNKKRMKSAGGKLQKFFSSGHKG